MKPTDRLLQQVLVLRYQAGDASAIEELVERHQGPLRYFVRSLLGRNREADDLLQDVWLTVIRKLRTLRNPGSFAPWLYRIARNRVYQDLRKNERFAALNDEAVPANDVESEGEFSPEDAATIHACLRRLRPGHREVLILRFFEDMTYENIAQVAGCGLGTVKSRIYHAKRALRKEMEGMADGR